MTESAVSTRSSVTIAMASYDTMTSLSPSEGLRSSLLIRRKLILASGNIGCHPSDDGRKLLIEFNPDKQSLTKTAVYRLIDGMKQIRETTVR